MNFFYWKIYSILLWKSNFLTIMFYSNLNIFKFIHILQQISRKIVLLNIFWRIFKEFIILEKYVYDYFLINEIRLSLHSAEKYNLFTGNNYYHCIISKDISIFLRLASQIFSFKFAVFISPELSITSVKKQFTIITNKL